jgi:hypothetical protein
MIVAAAIVYDGVIWTLPRPARHHHIIKAHFDVTGRAGSGLQGFVDDEGDFWSREAAGKMVAYDKQKTRIQPDGSWFVGGPLLSEDLW